MAETAAVCAALQQEVEPKHQLGFEAAGHTNADCSDEAQQLLHLQHAASSALPEYLQQLCSSIEHLNHTSDQLVQFVQVNHQYTRAEHQQQQQQQASLQQPQQTCSDSIDSTSDGVEELQQQLASLLDEKQRIEADRQEMALQQGKYKGTIAQLEGALAFSERKVKDQLSVIDKLQAQVSSLRSELQEARGAAAQTPDRCRTAARVLQEEADRAATTARSNEAQVKKLKHIIQLEAQQLSELLDFAEQERLTLLEKEAALQQEIEQLRSRAIAAEGGASDALAESAALEQQLATTRDELLSCRERVTQLEGLLADNEAQLQQAHTQAGLLAAERDAAARNLLRAEAELNDVSEYSTKMFRQVRFISHVLDKNSAMLSKLPEFVSLSRDLRAFVAANARTWEPRDAAAGAAPRPTAAATASVSNADTTASGMRDVAGKA